MPFKIGRGHCVLSLLVIEIEHFADATELSPIATPMKMFTASSKQFRRSYERGPVSFQFPFVLFAYVVTVQERILDMLLFCCCFIG